MASKIFNEINEFLLANSTSDFASLESALLGAILDSHGIHNLKNNSIKKLLSLNSTFRKTAYNWLKDNIPRPGIEHALIFYEVSISVKTRKFDGAYFTPQIIVDAIVDMTVKNNVGSVCDPACGSGAFLLGSVKKLFLNNAGPIPEILSKYIWGIDINKDNVEHTKTILALFSILQGADSEYFDIGIFHGNSLQFSWSTTPRKKAEFDFIVGNPPYVRGKNLSSELKKQIKAWPTASGGIADLYIPFFEIGYSWAKNNSGRIGYITPNTYFSSVNGRGLRKLIAENQILEKIIDLRGFPAFEGLLTYTCVTILDRSTCKIPVVGIASTASDLDDIRKIKLFETTYSELNKDDWYIQSNKIVDDMRRIETTGTPITNYVRKFTTGIATLRNDLYIFDSPIKNGYIERRIGDSIFQIEVKATVPIIKPNKVKDDLRLKLNRERVLYPYRASVDGRRKELIPEHELSQLYPGAYAYLKHIRPELNKRSSDKSASGWHAYGRSQALDGFGKKIICPMMADRPVFLWVDDPNTLIYCGYALYPKSHEDAKILLKILNSDVFWYYLSNTSKNYANGYKSFAKNYIKKFSIPNLSIKQRKIMLSLPAEKINDYLKELYGLINHSVHKTAKNTTPRLEPLRQSSIF